MRTFDSQSTSSVHAHTRFVSSLGVGGADVDDEVEVLELEALRHVGVAQARTHVGVLVHQREHAVHHLAELLAQI